MWHDSSPSGSFMYFHRLGRQLWHSVTLAPIAEKQPSHHRQIQLLSVTMLFLIIAGAPMSVIGSLVNYPGQALWVDPLFGLSVGAVLAVVVNYLILRRGHYTASVLILVLITALGAITISIKVDPTRANVDLYLLVPIIVASIFLQTRQLWQVILAYNVGLLLLNIYIATLHLREPIRVDALLVIGILIALSRLHLEQIERERTLALAASEARLRAITNTISDSIISTDHELIIRYISPAFTRLSGLPTAILLGRPIDSLRELVHPDDTTAEADRFFDAVGRREPASLTHRLRRADGSYLWLETICSPSAKVDGQPAQITLSSRDLSDRIEADEMRALDRMKDAFLSTVAHELRTPMTTIHGYAEMLTLNQTESDQQYFLDQIQQRAIQASRIVDDLLDVARIKAQGGPALQCDAIAIVPLIEDEVRVFREIYPDHRFVAAYPIALPLIYADGLRIIQVLRNLLSNAVKYAPEGSTIAICASRNAGGVEVRVSDQGPGLTPAQQAQIFEPFYRADGHRHIPGTGLGLTISRAIVELHHGSIRVESGPDHGNCFIIWLPAIDESA